MTRTLILLHRWLGVAFCLFFAMWFATGIVMHFVPFPALTEAERFGGLAPVDVHAIGHGPAEAVAASAIKDIERVRLLQRSDGPVYLLSGPSGVKALSATDLSSAAVTSEQLALAIAVDHSRRRGLDASQASVVERTHYDQWTVPNGLDPHRPLYRIALHDGAGTELYVSSTTGEVVRDTTRAERWWNYAGSVPHWLYPTAQPLGGVGSHGVVAVTDCGDRCNDRSRAWHCAAQDRAASPRLALSGLARLASLARPRLRDLRADLDCQRLAVDGPRPPVLSRQ